MTLQKLFSSATKKKQYINYVFQAVPFLKIAHTMYIQKSHKKSF